MKKGLLITGGILIVGALGAAGWYYFYGSSQSTTDSNTVYVTAISSLSETASGVENRYAGVVEPQKTVEVKIDSGRKVSEVQVKTGDEVKQGQLLFEYDLSSIQDDLQQAQLDLDRLKNEALSLTEQINTLTAEKQKADANSQLSYSIEIETNKMNLKKNEYNQTSKAAEIEKLQTATQNTEVRSELDGVIQKIDSSKIGTTDDGTVSDSVSSDDTISMDSSSDSSGAFITILSTGAYRIKGKVNEQNAQAIIEGEPVIIRSRVDENQTWTGTMGAVDRQNSTSDSSSSSAFSMMDSGDSQTTSSSYPFYVTLDSSDGLMLGQHVYIEKDDGQEEQKAGLWLSDFYIVNAEEEDPYVWTAGDNGKLEMRSVTLGQHDDDLMEYEIVDGLEEDDCITYPADGLEEGMSTAEADVEKMLNNTISSDETTENLDDGEVSDDMLDMEMPEAVMDGGDTSELTDEEMNEEIMLDETPVTEEDLTGDDLVPMEEAPGSTSSEDSEDLE